jgi:hypothetical protein
MNLGDPLPRLTRAVDPALAARLHQPGVRVEPFLSSRPTPRLRWLIDRVKTHLKPGDRLLYEEGGFAVPGEIDPWGDGRYSGLVPHYAPGVELLGGPYLHAALTTNFTQFGEGALFGRADWDRAHFDRFARMYRPTAIVCWGRRARAFCLANPDRVRVLDDDGAVLFGRVVGFEGFAVTGGTAKVEAGPGRLAVRVEPAEVDGRVVLRYHFAPRLAVTKGRARIEPVLMDGDPVPMIGARAEPGTSFVIEMRWPLPGARNGPTAP